MILHIPINNYALTFIVHYQLLTVIPDMPMIIAQWLASGRGVEPGEGNLDSSWDPMEERYPLSEASQSPGGPSPLRGRRRTWKPSKQRIQHTAASRQPSSSSSSSSTRYLLCSVFWFGKYISVGWILSLLRPAYIGRGSALLWEIIKDEIWGMYHLILSPGFIPFRVISSKWIYCIRWIDSV